MAFACGIFEQCVRQGISLFGVTLLLCLQDGDDTLCTLFSLSVPPSGRTKLQLVAPVQSAYTSGMSSFKFNATAIVLCLLLPFVQTAVASCACDEMPAKKQNMAKHCSEHSAAGDEAEKPIQAQHTMDGGATCSMMAGCHITALPALSFELPSSDFVVSQGVPIRLTLYCFDFPPPVKPPNVLLG